MSGEPIRDSQANKPDSDAASQSKPEASASQLLSQQAMAELFDRDREGQKDQSRTPSSNGLPSLSLEAPVVDRVASVQSSTQASPELQAPAVKPAPTDSQATPQPKDGSAPAVPAKPEQHPSAGPSDLPPPPPPPAQALEQRAVKIGNHDYQVGFGADGQTDSLNLTSPDGKSVLQLQREPDGSLKCVSATGEYAPSDKGLINFEGLPLAVGPDGKVQGDITFNSKGDLKYRVSNAPDAKEYDRLADGALIAYDLKDWKKTVVTPDGHAATVYWDGYEWRTGVPSADGNRVDFLPPDPDKPSFVQIDNSNGQRKATVGFNDGTSYACDFIHQSITEQIPGQFGQPAQTKELYYNGSSYQEAQQVIHDQPNPGDTTIVFRGQAGEPVSSIIHANGGITSTLADKTVVDKSSTGYVTSINGPKGNWNFRYDVNGDVEGFTHTYAGSNGQPVTDVMARNGAEQNPGMNHWYSRVGYQQPRSPDDLPPFDPNKPSGYDTYVDANGNKHALNINVSADGTVRLAQVGSDNKPAVSYLPPGPELPPPGSTPLPDAVPAVPHPVLPIPGSGHPPALVKPDGQTHPLPGQANPAPESGQTTAPTDKATPGSTTNKPSSIGKNTKVLNQ